MSLIRGVAAPVTRSASASPSMPLLALHGIGKGFHGVPVLKDVSLSVARGEVHALLGANGAGKSTLLKVLSGVHAPDIGTMEFEGVPARFTSPLDAQRRGIVAIHQEFSQFPDLTVAENVLIGRLPRNRLGFIDWRQAESATLLALQRLGFAVDPRRLVVDLSVAEQQLVEIARALTMKSSMIVMDEPTAALSRNEVERLRGIIAGLQRDGVGIIFVGHRLEEVKAICDRYTVLRDGAVAGSGSLADAAIDDLVRMMVGRGLEPSAEVAHRAGPVVLDVRGLVLREAGEVGPISFTVRAGEILGLAGLVGSGRSAIVRALFGADPFLQGTISLEGRDVTIEDPCDAIRLGIGLVPEDRAHQSLFPGLSVTQNFAMAGLGRFAGPLGWLGPSEASAFEAFRNALGIRLASGRQDIGTLSGGNQQKVVLARWLAIRPKVLIVDEPTRGIDIAAKADVHHLLRDLAASGVAVIVISSDLPEILSLSHRILTIRAGRPTGDILAREASEERLMRLMTLDPNAPAVQRINA